MAVIWGIRVNIMNKKVVFGRRGRIIMALTRDLKKTVLDCAAKDTKFRRGLFTEAVNEFLEGDIEVGKKLLCDYISAACQSTQ